MFAALCTVLFGFASRYFSCITVSELLACNLLFATVKQGKCKSSPEA
jgi:hypothetical protein